MLPTIHGSLQQSGFFIYAAADTRYFDLYGRALINSVLTNTQHGIHVHIYDPTDEQLAFCQRPRCSVSWEYLYATQFDSAMEFWSRWDLPEPWASRKNKMLGLKQFADNTNLALWIRKTYYACMRFVRLAELLTQPQRFLEIDIDGIVRHPFITQFHDDDDHDFYLYEKTKIDKKTGEVQKNGHLAGSILFTPKNQTMSFVRELADLIQHEITNNNIYWFLDQHSLDQVVPRYRKGLLPKSYIDWHMQPNSSIWTAKGRRKELEIFQRELNIYR